MKTDLKNKRILYIGPVSVFYDKALVKKLADLGAEVDTFNPFFTSFYFKLLKKIPFGSLEEFKRNHFDKLLSKTGFDYILVRHVSELENSHFSELRSKNPNAIFINFHWDALRNDYNYLSTLSSFDRVFSFDYKDCQQHKELRYLPLFFIEDYEAFKKNKNNDQKKYDILFIGSWRDQERYNLIQSTKEFCQRNDLKFYYYLQLPFKQQWNSIKKGVVPKESRNKLLSHKEILSLFSKSKTIIDFPSSFQTGLTMRTFEALGAGKKLITTNKNIQHEPFFDPSYINIIDAEDLDLDLDYIKSCPTHTIEEKIKNYSLESYIQHLFSI